MSDSRKMQDGLEAFFDAARAEAPDVPADLLARILADADAEQPRPAPRRPSYWRALFVATGGWRGAAGLATAALTGVWIGFSPPQQVQGIAQDIWGEQVSLELLDEVPLLDDYLTEG